LLTVAGLAADPGRESRLGIVVGGTGDRVVASLPPSSTTLFRTRLTSNPPGESDGCG